MPRKTLDDGDRADAGGQASMRPRPDAAENLASIRLANATAPIGLQ